MKFALGSRNKARFFRVGFGSPLMILAVALIYVPRARATTKAESHSARKPQSRPKLQASSSPEAFKVRLFCAPSRLSPPKEMSSKGTIRTESKREKLFVCLIDSAADNLDAKRGNKRQRNAELKTVG